MMPERNASERSALYFELRDALTAGGCPICRLGQQAADSYLNALIHEGVTDPDLREKLRDARGLCHHHAWRLANRRGSTLGAAIIYHDVTNTLIKLLEAQDDAPASGGLHWPGAHRGDMTALARRLGASAPCPACQLEDSARPRAVKTLLKYLDDPDIAAGYLSAGGLCLPHLQLALTQANDAQAHAIIAAQLTIYRALRAEMAELIRKHDHRFRGEPVSDEESDAWLRAIARIAGNEDMLPRA
jgi:hypothetical protein